MFKNLDGYINWNNPMFREWSNNYFFLNLVQLSIGFFFFFFFSSLFFKSSTTETTRHRKKKVNENFSIKYVKQRKKKLVYNLCNPLFTFYSLCPNRVRPVYQRAGHINWTFPGPMFVGTNGKQRYTSAIVTQCPRTSTYRWFLPHNRT